METLLSPVTEFIISAVQILAGLLVFVGLWISWQTWKLQRTEVKTQNNKVIDLLSEISKKLGNKNSTQQKQIGQITPLPKGTVGGNVEVNPVKGREPQLMPHTSVDSSRDERSVLSIERNQETSGMGSDKELSNEGVGHRKPTPSVKEEIA